MTIATNIKRLRKAANITQVELAEKIGLSGSGAVSQWETGLVTPTPDNLKRIAELLGVTVNELFYDKEAVD